MKKSQIHQFSPQRSNPEDLEAISVSRESLLNATVSKIRNSANTKNKHHRLFVGQRGIGKTHLLALVNHRVTQDEKLNQKLRVAWLNEDETSSQFLQLLLRIYRALSKRYPVQYPVEQLQPIIGTTPEEALARLTDLLLERTGKNTILLLIENLDAYFAKFKVEEQRRWRGFMQDYPIFTTVATAQRLFDGIAKQDEPFYGFFDTHQLSPLGVDETLELLLKIAKLTNDAELERVLGTSKGRSRLKVIHFLAGGNPRLYVLLAELITEDSLDDVVEAFETMVDRQLTHYYQERMRWLAPLQQDIVHVLCRHRPAVSVKTIAQELFTSNQSISSQLKELRGFGYVRATKDGRETRYELAEPLMRLVLQVKETNSQEPLRLLVEFLQAWFDRPDLESRLALQVHGEAGQRYLEAAIESYDRFQQSWPIQDQVVVEPNVEDAGDAGENSLPAEKLMAQGNRLFHAGDYESAIAKYTEVIEVESIPTRLVGEAWLSRGVAHGQNGDVDRSIKDFTSVIELKNTSVNQVATALDNRSVSYRLIDDIDSEMADYNAVIDLDDAPVDVVAKVLFKRGVRHGQIGDINSAITDYSAVIELEDAPVDLVARALNYRGVTHGQNGDNGNAIKDYSTVLELEDAPGDQVAKALCNRGFTHGQNGDNENAITDYSAALVLEDAPVDLVATALYNRGVSHQQIGDIDSEMADYNAVIELEDAPVDLVARALNYRGVTHGQNGDIDGAITDFNAVIELEDAPANQVAGAFYNRGAAHQQNGDIDGAITDFNAVIELEDAPANQVAIALSIRGAAHQQNGDIDSAITDYSAVIELEDAPVDLVATALSNRGVAHQRKGEIDRAITDFNSVLELQGVTMPRKGVALINRCVSNLKRNNVDSALADLSSILDVFSPNDFLATAELAPRGFCDDILTVLADLPNSNRGLLGVRILERLQEAKLDDEFGQALLGQLRDLKDRNWNAEQLAEWNLIWQELGSDLEALNLPLRLMDVGIAYLISRSETELLELPLEERRIVRSMLGLDQKI